MKTMKKEKEAASTIEVTEAGPRDKTRIDITNEEHMQWWCSQLSCNEMRLKNAVASVGPTADAVRHYLKKEVPQL